MALHEALRSLVALLKPLYNNYGRFVFFRTTFNLRENLHTATFDPRATENSRQPSASCNVTYFDTNRVFAVFLGGWNADRSELRRYRIQIRASDMKSIDKCL
jgi:hypothetical protein